jgi:tetratricopeptide (TPR) repeat protein
MRSGKAVQARTAIWIAGGVSILVIGGWRVWTRPHSWLTPDAIWQRAQSDLSAGRHDEVRAALDRLSKLRSPTPMDWLLRAQLAIVQNRPDEALASLARIPDSDFSAPRARLLTGQIERSRDRVRLAEEAFRAAVGLDPALAQAHRELIYIYGLQLRRPEINREFVALRKLTRLSYDEVYRWTSLLNNSWEPGDIIGDLLRFVAADPADRWSRLALAENLRRMGHHTRADLILAVLPRDDIEANVVRAKIAFDRQEVERANELLDLAKSDDAGIARLRGRQAIAQRDAQSAVRYFRTAHAADPNDHETLAGLQIALEMLHEVEEVGPIRDMAHNLDRLNTLIQRAASGEVKRNRDLLRQIGTTCAALRRNDEARAWLELAIARNPLDAAAQQAMFRLKSAIPESLRSQAIQD